MSQEREDPPTAEGSPRDGSLQAHSCLLCKQRKVRCDKHFPCAACTRAKVQCIFRAPAPPRRGKRKPNEVNLLARVKRYEDMLQALGVSIESIKIEDSSPKVAKEGVANVATIQPPVMDTGEQQVNIEGKFITEEGKSMYFDNFLWKSLSDALPTANEMLYSSDDEPEEEYIGRQAASPESVNDMVLSSAASTSIKIAHPLPSQIIRLWQVFIGSINPLCKVLHEPTTYKSILAATADLSNIPRNFEALLFAIYSITIFSMEPRECEDLFAGEKKSVILPRYQLATRLALQKAGLLKTNDLMTLQAFMLYLFSVRTTLDPRILWIYTGIVLRLAQRIGMHRDGSRLSIPPFESEMRRRLWWQVLTLDMQASQTSGVASNIPIDSWDSGVPLNINDEDMWPEMTELPAEREGATEMFFCMIRYEFGRVFKPVGYNSMEGTRLWGSQANLFRMSIEERDRLIDEADKRISDRWLRFADPFNDLHILTLGVARTALSSMRLMVHHPRQYEDGGASMSQEEKDFLFNNALRIVEYDRNVYGSSTLRRFRWHVTAFFQLNAFVFVLNELSVRIDSEQVVSAWKLVEEVYENHPELMDGDRRAVILALANLTLKAWHKFESGKQIRRPSFVQKMLARKLAMSHRDKSSDSASTGRSPAQFSQTPSTTGGRTDAQEYPTPPMTDNTSPNMRGSARETSSLSPPQQVHLYSSDPSGPYGSITSTIPDAAMQANAATGLVFDTEAATMDWAAWDNIIQDSALEGFDDATLDFNFNM